MTRIDIIAGARPNFMKIAPIIHALEKERGSQIRIDYRLIHTGQHYDASMSGSFFAQLGIPDPHVNLEVGSGSAAEQTGTIMLRYEQLLQKERSDMCLVVGDVTSTMACAIAAQKLNIPVAHVEGGIRSGDWTMPEEINRLVTDSISNYFFITSSFARENLRKSGVSDDRIFFVGNTMIDTLLANLPRLQQPQVWQLEKLQRQQYFVLTLHRPSNVDDANTLQRLLSAIETDSGDLPIVFPVHPRTKKNLDLLERLPRNLKVIGPQPYLEFNYLVQHAKAVITDSGGITEETTVLGVPCMTLRNSTERPETVEQGTNELLGSDPAAIGRSLKKLFAGQWKKGTIPEKWDGQAGARIVSALQQIFADSKS